MKKIFAVILVCLTCATGISAQKNALGLHFGYGVELSYQRELSNANRVEVDLGFPGYKNVGLTATYQWVNPIPTFPKGFDWYYGVGAQVGFGSKHFHLGAAGVIGIEYTLPSFPLQFSLDYTPVLGFRVNDSKSGFYDGLWGFNLGIRYKF